MNWERKRTLHAGETWTVEADLCPLELSFETGHLTYSRPRLEAVEADEPVDQTVLIDSLGESVTVDFLPLYPDRPIIFTLEDSLSIPPGESGFFCLPFRVGIGFTLRRTKTTLENLTPKPRKKAYWGPPNNGISTYQTHSNVYTDPPELMQETGIATAVVPVYYRNDREEESRVEQCLVPLQELDLYRNESDDLIFEVVTLTHSEDYYQEPRPLKRPPKEIKQAVSFFLSAPNDPKSLFEQVRTLPRLTNLTSLLLNR